MTAICGAISAAVISLVSTGWLVLPAKQTDLEQLEKQILVIEMNVKATRGDVVEIRRALQDLIALAKVPHPEKK